MKVELNTATPSEQILADAAKDVNVTADNGKVLTIRKPGVLAQFRLVEALGGETASNRAYMGMVLPLIYLSHIDGEVVFPPATKNEVEALIQQLDDAGMAALIQGVNDHFGASADMAAEVDKAKK